MIDIPGIILAGGLSRRMGGGVKRKYRLIDFKRIKTV